MRRPARLVAAAVVLIVAVGCRDNGPSAGQAQVRVSGDAALVTADGRRALTGTRTIDTGDRLEVTSGSVLMILPGGATVEMRAAKTSAPTRVQLDTPPRLEVGEALLTAIGRPAAVESDGTRVNLPDGGAVRLSNRSTLRISTFTGRAVVTSAGRTLAVPALRETSVPSLGLLARRPRPLLVDGSDPWDRRFLGRYLTLGADLEDKVAGFNALARADEATSVAYFRDALPGLADTPGFSASVVPQGRTPGDRLVAICVALLSRQGDFATRLERALTFHDDGADWGLVALDQDISPDALSDLVDGALDGTDVVLAAPRQPARPSSTPTTAGPSTSPTTQPGPSTSPTTTPPTTEPPPEGGPLTGLVDDVSELLGGLLNGVTGTGQGEQGLVDLLLGQTVP